MSPLCGTTASCTMRRETWSMSRAGCVLCACCCVFVATRNGVGGKHKLFHTVHSLIRTCLITIHTHRLLSVCSKHCGDLNSTRWSRRKQASRPLSTKVGDAWLRAVRCGSVQCACGSRKHASAQGCCRYMCVYRLHCLC